MTTKVELTCVSCDALLLLVVGNVDTTTYSPVGCPYHPKARIRIKSAPVDESSSGDGES